MDRSLIASYFLLNVLTSVALLAFTFYNNCSNGGGGERPPLLLNFERFDNENENASRRQNQDVVDDNDDEDASRLLVPNIVHLIYLSKSKMRFHEMICIFSIYLNQRPDMIVIHCEKCSFTGYYWNKILKVAGLRAILRLNRLPIKRTIFGQKIRFIHHRY